MRSPLRLHRTPALVALLALAAACDRDPLREEARPADPSLASASTPGLAAGAFRVGALNERGTIIGNQGDYYLGATGMRGYRWTRAGGLELLSAIANARSEFVLDVNNAGTAVGGVDSTFGGNYRVAIWPASGSAQVIPLPPGWYYARASAINDAGVIAGTAFRQDGSWAFRWTPETGFQLLPRAWGVYTGPAAGYQEEIVDINDAGDIIANVEEVCYEEAYPGIGCYEEGRWYGAVMWPAAGGVRVLVGRDVEPSSVHDISDNGLIVGCVHTGPVLWHAGMSQRALPGGGCATAVNEAGMVSGTFDRAWIWTEAGGLRDLGAPAGGSAATDVNEAGEVTGWYSLPSGLHRAFVWTEQAGMQPLTLPRGTEWSEGRFINDAGEVAGTAGRGSYPQWVQGTVRWSDTMVDHPPLADAGGPYTRRITGHRYSYSALGSVTADTATRYWWDMDGDGRYEYATASSVVTHVYASPGRHTIRMVVRDGAGRLDTASTYAEMAANAAPVITATGLPTSVAEGAVVPHSLSVKDANWNVDFTELGSLRYRWEWGDGAVSATPDARHRYADQGRYTIRLTVTDAGGLADTAVYTMSVGNVAPTGRLIAPTSVGEGATFTLFATALRDAPADLAAGFTVAFNCGGGFGAYGTATSIVCPARPDQGSVTVRMRVKDKDGAASEAAKTIPVGNVAPRVTANATSPTTFSAGGSFSVSATFTDVAADAPWRYRIYWGDGASTPLTAVPGGSSIKGSHAYASPGTYTVQVAVADKDGGSGRSAPITVTVTP